jgi:hypothetical protein
MHWVVVGVSYGKPKRQQLQDIKLLHESDFFISVLYFITRNIFFLPKNDVRNILPHIGRINFLLSHQEKCSLFSTFFTSGRISPYKNVLSHQNFFSHVRKELRCDHKTNDVTKRHVCGVAFHD